MAKPIKGTPRPFRQVPNAQVRDIAIQFHDAYRLLISQPPFSGVLMPALHCASIAMELYLKSLTAREVEVPDPLLAGAAFVHAESPYPHHKLEELFDATPADAKAAAEAHRASVTQLQKFSSIRDALALYTPMFTTSRYLFEPSSDLSKFDLETIRGLLEALRKAVDTIRVRFER